MSFELTILGAGTLIPDDRRRSPGHLVETEGARILLDCGSGTLHGLEREKKDWWGVSHVAISHFHTDHVGDLAALFWAWKHGGKTREPMSRKILGPRGLRRLLRALAEAHGEHVLEPGGPLEIVELEPRDTWEDPGAGITVGTHPTPHNDESVAFRVAGEGWAVGYTGDTGPSPELGTFLEAVDILIAECALPDHLATEGHLSPATVTELAVAAAPRVLVLTHFYPEVQTDSLPDLIRTGGYSGTVHAGYDGLRLRSPGS